MVTTVARGRAHMTVFRREDVQSCSANAGRGPGRIVCPPILTIVPLIIRRLRGPGPAARIADDTSEDEHGLQGFAPCGRRLRRPWTPRPPSDENALMSANCRLPVECPRDSAPLGLDRRSFHISLVQLNCRGRPRYFNCLCLGSAVISANAATEEHRYGDFCPLF